MYRSLLLAIVATGILIAAAQADPVPAAALDADYQACLGGLPAQADAQRVAYCGCVRDGMSGWDSSTYAAVAQQAQTATASAPPAALASLAQGCIAKVLK